jgi:hypothetical protein
MKTTDDFLAQQRAYKLEGNRSSPEGAKGFYYLFVDRDGQKLFVFRRVQRIFRDHQEHYKEKVAGPFKSVKAAYDAAHKTSARTKEKVYRHQNGKPVLVKPGQYESTDKG